MSWTTPGLQVSLRCRAAFRGVTFQLDREGDAGAPQVAQKPDEREAVFPAAQAGNYSCSYRTHAAGAPSPPSAGVLVRELGEGFPEAAAVSRDGGVGWARGARADARSWPPRSEAAGAHAEPGVAGVRAQAPRRGRDPRVRGAPGRRRGLPAAAGRRRGVGRVDEQHLPGPRVPAPAGPGTRRGRHLHLSLPAAGGAGLVRGQRGPGAAAERRWVPRRPGRGPCGWHRPTRVPGWATSGGSPPSARSAMPDSPGSGAGSVPVQAGPDRAELSQPCRAAGVRVCSGASQSAQAWTDPGSIPGIP